MALNTCLKGRYALKILGFFCVLFTMGLSPVHGQLQHVADSLRLIYMADTVQGVNRLVLLRELAFNEVNNPEQALDYANELISLSREMGNTEFLYSGYMQKGNSQLNQGDLDLVLEAYRNAEEIAEKEGSKIRQSTALFSLAYTYTESGDLERAEENFEKSLAVLRDPEVESQKAGKWALAEALFNAGDFYLRQGQYDKAETYLLEAGELFQELEFNTGYAYYLGNMGVLYTKTGDLEQARTYLVKAIELLEENQDFAPVAEYQTKLAELYLEEEDFSQGHSLANQALEHALRLNLTNQVSETSAVLARLDSITGNYKEAYGHLNLHMAYKDSMDVATVDMTRLEREKAELQVQRQESELQLQAVQQKRQQLTIWAVGITALLLTIIAFGSYKRYRFVKNTNQIISEERDKSDNLLQNILPKQT
ncbi:MAG: tetratricopeptide repeat protein, partial [Robiginitalea sp.]|uniref:tetratricopeptide repeat protein n=1 Tax=Robiginitalea sp. TaxID=1902411 RepID=UPI003C77F42E